MEGGGNKNSIIGRFRINSQKKVGRVNGIQDYALAESWGIPSPQMQSVPLALGHVQKASING